MNDALTVLCNLLAVIDSPGSVSANMRAAVFADARALAWTEWRRLPTDRWLRRVVISACTIDSISPAGAHWNEGLILLAISELEARVYGEWEDEDYG